MRIAAHTALIAAPEQANVSQAVALLQQNPDKELVMASDIHDRLPHAVRQYIALSASDQRADI